MPHASFAQPYDPAPLPLLRVAISDPDPGTVVVTPTGEADLCTAPLLRRAVDQALESRRPRLVVVELDELTFLDASTLGVVVDVRRRVEARGGALRIRARQPLVRQLLRITGLVEVLDRGDDGPGRDRSSLMCRG